MKFHPLHTDIRKPARFNNPFSYEPHQLCVIAACEVREYIAGNDELKQDAGLGKMFGVLVVEDGDGRTGYLAAYSGLLAGRNDHAFFVPPVFDAMSPDGYFKTHEAEITAINRRIDDLMKDERYKAALAEAGECRRHCAQEEAAFRQKMKEAKRVRDERRLRPEGVTPEEDALMIRESQFMKAELVRIKRRNAALMAEKDKTAAAFEEEISALKAKRRQMSDSLQHWLFSRYDMLNALGERRNLCSIFADTPGRVPPAGAGDCCAPKLLQHAYLNGLRPVCMAEFWYGASPKGEIRLDGNYYPSCRGKCLPILGHMLRGLDVDTATPEQAVCQPLEIVYEDEWLAVVNKPPGMASVPGRSGGTSVIELMKQRSLKPEQVIIVHRLDMDTSGLIIIAYGMETYKDLQRQFILRTVKKRYIALLDGHTARPTCGRITLPLYSDPLDRPYQKVDYDRGKTAVTDYRILSTSADMTRIALFPQTGRTHQLRVHCAHADGLAVPIVGDRLYGHKSGRLCLHAEALTFVHPATGKEMTFERKAGF